VASVYSIRPAAETDIDTLVDFTLREAAEAERLTLSIEEATTGVRGGFATPPLSTYCVAVDATDAIVATTSVVKEWSNFHGGYGRSVQHRLQPTAAGAILSRGR
jgi:hypothetical protein